MVHAGGTILPPCSISVLSNGRGQARATDPLTCVGSPAPNFIVTGAAMVLVDGLPAARMTDKTMHPPPGVVLEGSGDIEIGGPAAGATLGGGGAAKAACLDAKDGRTSGRIKQSYGNCGVESARQIINAAPSGVSINEEDLLNQSIGEGDAGEDPKPSKRGGTGPIGRREILERNGVPSHLEDPSMQNITQAIAERRGVITSHEIAILWGSKQTGGHAIVAMGVEYDANGEPLNVIVNDTGKGRCGYPVPYAVFVSSLRPGREVNVTDHPVW
jgi:uncharacterized Zn-binding protein involved in type VI secretion